MDWDRLLIFFILLAASCFFLAASCVIPSQYFAWCPENRTPTPDARQVDKLLSLGYMATAEIAPEDRNKSNVMGNVLGSAYPGISVYCTEDGIIAYFMDMDGTILHSITAGEDKGCNFLTPVNENEFLMIHPEQSIESLDWDSNVNWITYGRFHHDLDLLEDGDIWALRQEYVNYTEINPHKPILNHYLVVLAPGGKIKRELSFADMVSKDKHLLSMVSGKEGDIFHLNTLEMIRKDVYSGGKRLFGRGDILTSSRSMSIIAVIDPNKGEIVWHWGEGLLEGQHQPTMLDNGNILLFDNGQKRKYSRAIEVNPATGNIEWEYRGKPPESFYSDSRGGVQRLPNGNTLITESDKGHVFEVTGNGTIVWDFWEPHLEGDQRKAIYRMARLVEPLRNLTAKGLAPQNAAVSPKKTPVCDAVKDPRNADRCHKRIGMELANASLCMLVKDKVELSGCLENVAVSQKNSSLCQTIPNATYADSCYGRIGVNTSNASLCMLVGDLGELSGCLENVAVSLKNSSLCEIIPDAGTKDACLEFNAVYANDTGLCDGILSTRGRGRCYGRLAAKTGDVSLCKPISVPGDADQCIGDAAEAAGDPALCAGIAGQSERDRCYSNVAESTNQAAACEKITEEWRRDQCTKRLKKGKIPPG